MTMTMTTPTRARGQQLRRSCMGMMALMTLLPLVGGDLFDSFDANHDNMIDRTEYDQGMLKLSAYLEAPLDERLLSGQSWFTLPSLNFDGFWPAFTSGVAMILATEIGDKTFFIAAVLSMRHDRSAVFGGAIVALIIMTILSSALGVVLPAILPKQYTHLLGGALFLYFGIKLILESRKMEANRHSEELEEVEEELMTNGKKQEGDEEQGQQKKRVKKASWSQVWLQALTLTFLAEWGDRSQIATIALAAHKNPYGVTFGGCLGHSICTGLAVMGGRMLAARISEKTVSFWGGMIFLVFGIHSLFWEE